MTAAPAQPQPKHHLLITIPRTASNLLIHLLNAHNQPSIVPHPQDGYFFLPAIAHRYKHNTFTRPLETWTNDEEIQMQDLLDSCLFALTRWIDDADRQGKGTFVKEHINWMITPRIESQFLHGSAPNDELTHSVNPSCLPDSLFSKVCPTFLIRHPALAFPSLVRVAIDNEGFDTIISESAKKTMEWEATYHWHIRLYKSLMASSAYPRPSNEATVFYPIIIDASDLANFGLVQKYARAVGLDSNLVQFEWTATRLEHQAKLNKTEASMKDTLLSSQGLIMNKLKAVTDLDVLSERGKWEEDFGKVLAERL